ncbi:Pc22g02370 [Penicillium rubens Wisconsin 54-1255]|uniref:Pc22g02370 protein n=1 Tax=Penicillium rubens (strain ATCC 28089 / DSM 1075 / NRRL 1951 / Wisconsin 54-1255) TaxID=500485 RepID=B6HPA3_PENRW|nr:Pc22g02370 [Penicillium rubens Wisconsin 54-1255]
MAEVVGVVSSVITFATVVVQVTESIITIKDCWSQFGDASSDLKYLLKDFELFGLVPAEIEEDVLQEAFAFALTGNKHAMQSLEFSREAATSLQALTNELASDMNSSSRLRKSYAAAKVVMQRGKLERHMARLRNAIQLLSLSQQCYTRALLRVQPDLIAEKLLVQDMKNTAKFKPNAHQHEHTVSDVNVEDQTMRSWLNCLAIHRANNQGNSEIQSRVHLVHGGLQLGVNHRQIDLSLLNNGYSKGRIPPKLVDGSKSLDISVNSPLPDLIQTMLGPDLLTSKDLQVEGPWGFDSKNTTLVHCVVRKIGATKAALQGSHPWKKQRDILTGLIYLNVNVDSK